MPLTCDTFGGHRDPIVFRAGQPMMVALDVDGTLHVARDTDPRAHESISAAHGVAMGHSPPSVRAIADEICPAGAEDGLATTLSRWFR